MNDFLDGSSAINSIIGEGTRFQGDLELSGLLRIDGDYEGTIQTDGRVLIGRNGRALCRIQADTVIVGGVVKGDIVCRGKLVILSTGMVIGNVHAPDLIVEEGVILDGRCLITRDEKRARSERDRLTAGSFSVDWDGKGADGQKAGAAASWRS